MLYNDNKGDDVMSYAIGSRIKDLRATRKVSQEKMAEVLDTTRQRYARLENGQVDISYVVIKKVADHLGVSVSEITSAEEEKKGLLTFFREKELGEDILGSVSKIEEILQVFHAHEKLYYQMRDRDMYAD